MSITTATYRTVTCDGPNCPNKVTFEASQEKEIDREVPWLKTLRLVQTAQGRVFSYCSDSCLVSHAGTGALNPEERKRIAIPGGADPMAEAAKHAEEQEKAMKAIKRGS